MENNQKPITQQASSLTERISLQREALKQILNEPMFGLASACAKTTLQVTELESLLTAALPGFSFCKHLFVLDAQFIQITRNITRSGADESYQGRDRSDRPYTVDILGETDFKLSDGYISRNKKRPSLTAMQVIRNEQGQLLGFLGADFDMRELPHTQHCYRDEDNWKQMKGDPAIRQGLFLQQRSESVMDVNIDSSLANMNELMTEYGAFHGKFHFSSSRATVWHRDDPYTYHLLNVNELISPDIFLAYPRRAYFKRAIVPAKQINAVFDMFKQLRFADNNIYLRSGSLNLVNGLVGLNFSCDGSHYMRFDEFLEKSTEFWFGKVACVNDNS